MFGYGKTLFLSALGFTVPIYAALHFSPGMFRYGPPPVDYSRASLSVPSVSPTAAAGEDRLLPEPQSAALSVPSDTTLDPGPESYFVVSVDVKINSLPRLGKRQKLVSKYSNESTPYPGWGLAIRRLNTSTRPEVYWQNRDGKGGWYTFDNVRFDRNRWYSLTLVARDGDLLSLYLEPLEPAAGEEGAASDASSDGSAKEVRFLGGYNLTGVAAAQTAAPFEFSPPVTENGDFRGQIRNVLIARPGRLPPRQEKLRELLDGGSEALVSRIEPQEVALWIDESGADRSPAQRSISQSPRT